ncbi:RNA polymerase sigma factor [Fibrella forsythiae]|uniref:Sigma-70 family RNA polymerase sigma factor n=1 Tax=Fibrella forsythiae TaxID=2817061 RepID=A0ABS3JFT0_9BACT|nr:sigma-70 family RNA polymerase sigma factor [Fibrella forsythiae]MBO0948861.1 sigma-70 family RNA polymerase sigma factor [Fibrella forsythiae]
MRETTRLLSTDEALLIGLAEGSDRALSQLYRQHYPMVSQLVINNSGSADDAQDIYQETLIVLFEKVSAGDFELNCQLKTFIYAVARRLWLKQLAQRGRSPLIRANQFDEEPAESIADDLADHQRRDQQFDQMAESLAKLGEPCRTLLEDFYIRHLSMQAITEKFGYTNTDNAKTQKYKCLTRLKRLFFSSYKDTE